MRDQAGRRSWQTSLVVRCAGKVDLTDDWTLDPRFAERWTLVVGHRL